MDINFDAKLNEIANKDFVSVHPKDSIKNAEILFKRINRKILPVVSDGSIRGILFQRDFQNIKKTNQYIVKLFDREFQYGNMYVEDYMTDQFFTLSSEAKVIEAIEFFKNKRQYFIPIVEERKLTGFITPFDVFNFILKENNNKK